MLEFLYYFFFILFFFNFVFCPDIISSQQVFCMEVMIKLCIPSQNLPNDWCLIVYFKSKLSSLFPISSFCDFFLHLISSLPSCLSRLFSYHRLSGCYVAAPDWLTAGEQLCVWPLNHHEANTFILLCVCVKEIKMMKLQLHAIPNVISVLFMQCMCNDCYLIWQKTSMAFQ